MIGPALKTGLTAAIFQIVFLFRCQMRLIANLLNNREVPLRSHKVIQVVVIVHLCMREVLVSWWPSCGLGNIMTSGVQVMMRPPIVVVVTMVAKLH